jgi:hypothetical protein
VVEQLADVAGHPRTALDGEGTALAEVVLDIHDEKGAGHAPSLSIAHRRSRGGWVVGAGVVGWSASVASGAAETADEMAFSLGVSIDSSAVSPQVTDRQHLSRFPSTSTPW